MPMTPEDIAEMNTLLAAARKRPVNFGLCLGKKPDATVLLLHRKKPPTILGRLAKKSGDTAKIAVGTLTLKGKTLLLSPEEDPPGGIAKKLKMFFSSKKMKMKIVLLDAAGNTLESDGDDADAEETTDTDTAPAPQETEWKAVFAALDGAVGDFVTRGEGKAENIGKAWAKAVATAQKADFKTALAMAAQIKPHLAAKPASGAAKKWAAAKPVIGKMYTRAMANNPANRRQLQAAWALANEKAEADDHGAALKIIAKLKAALEALLALGDGAGSDQDVVPDNVVAFQRASILWRQTREKMQKSMTALEDAIIAECKDDPELAPLAGEARDLSKRLQVFDTVLIDQLDAITNTGAGPAREALKKQATAQLKTYAAALGEPFFKDVDSHNGFVDVSVAATARQALVAIAKTLQ